MELNLFPPEETKITCKTPDGSLIVIDAFELDLLISEVQFEASAPIPLKDFLVFMVDKFAESYKFRMSLRSMDVLLEEKRKILDKVKKNTYQESEPANSMESPQEQTESSDSLPSSNES